jgi:GTPase
MTEEQKNETFDNLKKLVNMNHSVITNIDKINSNSYMVIIEKKEKAIIDEIRIILLGCSGSGKTTFLSNIMLDKIVNHMSDIDPRLYIMNHKHELETKKTSSFSCHNIIYNNIKYVFMEAPGSEQYIRTKYKILLCTKPNIILLFTNKDGIINPFDIFICNTLNIPYIVINCFDNSSPYYCKMKINKTYLYDIIYQTYKKYDNIDYGFTAFNIINMYQTISNDDMGIVVSGFLENGSIKVNNQYYWLFKNTSVNCTVLSIHSNMKSINFHDKKHIITICLKINNIMNKHKSMKYGIITNRKINTNKIYFSFKSFNNTILSPKQRYIGYCNNRMVHINNIIMENENILYSANITNYYNEKIIILDGIGIIIIQMELE